MRSTVGWQLVGPRILCFGRRHCRFYSRAALILMPPFPRFASPAERSTAAHPWHVPRPAGPIPPTDASSAFEGACAPHRAGIEPVGDMTGRSRSPWAPTHHDPTIARERRGVRDPAFMRDWSVFATGQKLQTRRRSVPVLGMVCGMVGDPACVVSLLQRPFDGTLSIPGGLGIAPPA